MHRYYWFSIFVIVALSMIVLGCRSPKIDVDEKLSIELATWNPNDTDVFLESTVGVATITISNNCVLLILENGKSVLPIWPEPTSWDETLENIKFQSVYNEQLDLYAGDKIMTSGFTKASNPLPVSYPSQLCESEEEFVLNSVRIVSETD